MKNIQLLVAQMERRTSVMKVWKQSKSHSDDPFDDCNFDGDKAMRDNTETDYEMQRHFGI